MDNYAFVVAPVCKIEVPRKMHVENRGKWIQQ